MTDSGSLFFCPPVMRVIRNRKEMENQKMSSFKDLRIVDNFYQTSSYIPMPTVMISSLAEDGSTSVGSYSLCFPYYIAGKDYYALILEARNSSNTAQHLLAGRK